MIRRIRAATGGGEGPVQCEGDGHQAMALPSAEFGRDNCLLAAVGIFGEMVLHAGLDAARAGLNIRTGALDIRLAGPDQRHAAQQGLLALLGKGGEVLLDAVPQPSLAGLNAGAMLLDLRSAGLAHRHPLRHGTDGRHQQEGRDGEPPYRMHVVTLPGCRPGADRENR